MLILSRKPDEKLILKTEQGDIEIMVLKVIGNRVSIGIDAPDAVKIYRDETLKKK